MIIQVLSSLDRVLIFSDTMFDFYAGVQRIFSRVVCVDNIYIKRIAFAHENY